MTIWERFCTYFSDAGVPTDCLLYSNYERLVDALIRGEVTIAWNTNTAYVATEQRVGGIAQVLGMRDIDAHYCTIIVTRRNETVELIKQLGGRRLALGSRDSGHAAILPLFYLAREGFELDQSLLLRFDTDLGKHGDTGDSELRVLEAVSNGSADAGAVGEATWTALRTQGHPAVVDLEVTWRSPTYYHCNFTALPTLERQRALMWSEALLAMDYGDPTLQPAMQLEGVRRWREADKDGYCDLAAAMHEQGCLS